MMFRSLFSFVIVLSALFLTAFGQEPGDLSSWKDPKNTEAVPQLAQRLLSRDFRDLSGQPREELLAKSLASLQDIAADNAVVPTTRYNAVLAAGQLDSKGGNPAEPYSKALPYLISVYQKADSPDYLKYGALLGIVRHTSFGISDQQQQNAVVDLLLETVSKELKADTVVQASNTALPLEPAVWDWFRLTALDGLSCLKTVGQNGKVVTTLLAVINSKVLELNELYGNWEMFTPKELEQVRRVIELASKVAKTLGDLNYKAGGANVDSKKIGDAFIALVKAVCDVEYKLVADMIEPPYDPAMSDNDRTAIPLRRGPPTAQTGKRRGVNPYQMSQTQTALSGEQLFIVEQVTIETKTCTQSVAWGIRGSFLTGKPGDNSIRSSLPDDNAAAKRLDTLLTSIVDLTAFFDEGDKTRRPPLPPPPANVKMFRFNLTELRDALAKRSEVLAVM